MADELDTDCFIERLQRLYTKCDDPIGPCFEQVDYLVCVNGSINRYAHLEKQNAFVLWLMKWDILDLIIIFGKKVVCFLCKFDFLTLLQSSLNDEALLKIKNTIGVDIQFIETNDNQNNNIAVYTKVIKDMENDQKYGKIGVLGENSRASSIEKLWYQCVNDSNFVKEDMSGTAAYLMSIKDQKEIIYMKENCNLSGVVQFKTAVIIRKIRYSKFQTKFVTNKHVATKVRRDTLKGKNLLNEECNLEFFEFCYPPIIQSMGNYNLSLNSGSDKNKFESDVIIMSLGIRYYQFCASITRTHISMKVKNDEIEANNTFLIRIQEFVIDKLRDGIKLSEVYEDTVDVVKRERPDLVGNLTDNFGSVIGIEAEEKFFEINKNNGAIARENMTFNVTIGFNFIVDQSKTVMKSPPYTYSLWIGDVVKVEKDKPATFLAPEYTREHLKYAIY